MRPLHLHPFFQKLDRVPITLVKEPVDRSDLGMLAIDTYGTKRMEQAYDGSSRRGFIHMNIAVSPAGFFASAQKNPEDASKDRKPFVFPLSQSKAKIYFHSGLNDSYLFHVVVKRDSGEVDKAEILRARVDVEPRYLHPPAWFLEETRATSIDEWESGSGFQRAPNGVRLLTRGESVRFQKYAFSHDIEEAMYVLNKLPHAIMGAYFADQSIPAIFSYRRSPDHVAFSDHRIGPFASTGVTAAVRRFTHRANSLQLDSVLKGNTTLDVNDVRAIVHGMQAWRRPYAA